MKSHLLPTVLVFVLSGSIFLATEANGAIYMKIEGLDGEAIEDNHKNWIDILSLSDSSNSKSVNGEGDLPKEIILVKELDKSSPKLAESLLKGKVLPKVWLDFCPREKSTCFDTFELINVVFTSYSINGSSDQIPIEEFSLNFESFRRSSPPEDQTSKDTTMTDPRENSIDTEMLPHTRVPGWVQTTAQFWVDKNVSDREFTDALGFLVKEKIIDVYIEPQIKDKDEKPEEPKVPSWISETTKWWIDGKVPEDQFLEGIKWMIKNNIIQGL